MNRFCLAVFFLLGCSSKGVTPPASAADHGQVSAELDVTKLRVGQTFRVNWFLKTEAQISGVDVIVPPRAHGAIELGHATPPQLKFFNVAVNGVAQARAVIYSQTLQAGADAILIDPPDVSVTRGDGTHEALRGATISLAAPEP